MATENVVDESLFDSLRDLRSEEQALLALLNRASAQSNAEVLRHHRHRLGRIRQRIEERLPEAFQMCNHCVNEAQRLRHTIQTLRQQLHVLQEKAGRGGNSGPDQKHAQAALRQEYRQVYSLLERYEYYLSVMDEFLPGLSQKLRGDLPRELPPILENPIQDEQLEETAPDEVPDCAPHKVFRADRRVHKRVPLAVPVRCRLDGETFLAKSADVSIGGMFIETTRSLPAGTEMTVVFCAAEGFPVEVRARVMYDAPGPGVGVKFLEMPETDGTYLEALIKEIEKSDGV